MREKIISLRRARILCEQLRCKKKTIVFTNGCFDILHLGHVRYLQAARKCGDVLIVGLNTDVSVRRLKGNDRPLNQEKHRAEVLAALSCVDYVVLFNDDTPYELIRALQPDVLAKGSDYQHGEIVGEDIVRERGGCVKRIRLEKGLSTTNVIKKIQKTK